MQTLFEEMKRVLVGYIYHETSLERISQLQGPPCSQVPTIQMPVYTLRCYSDWDSEATVCWQTALVVAEPCMQLVIPLIGNVPLSVTGGSPFCKSRVVPGQHEVPLP